MHPIMGRDESQVKLRISPDLVVRLLSLQSDSNSRVASAPQRFGGRADLRTGRYVRVSRGK